MLASSSCSWRLVGWLAILVVGLFLVACSADDPQQAESEPRSAAEQSEQQQARDHAQDEPEPEAVEQPQAQAEQQPAESAVAQAQQAAERQQAEAETTEQAAQEQQTAAQAPAEQQAAAQQAQSSPATGRTLEGVRGIVDPSNNGWPREVEGLNGIVTIPAKPMRIITASIGHDEVTLALVPNERLVAVGGVSRNATYSNIAAMVQDKPEISRDPEVIVAQSPDVVVTSPYFPVEAIDALERVGIVVVQTELVQSPQARIDSILLMGYIFGEEERAFEFADEVQARYEALIAITSSKSPQPSVLALTQYSDTLWVAGGNSTEGGVIVAAGGVNAAEAAGIQGNQTTSLEGVIAMAPSVIIIPQPLEFGAEEFRQSLLDNEALAEVPAIRDGAVHVVESKHFTTLSFWNIRGAEDLARLLWPEDFPDPPAESFSVAE
ncbi:MAG: ABC transporter substrate-binding protein [Chloroflexota bacterium]|nr:ABC transporter substrate-binding protein [Chloroflexota bacterium]